MGEKVIVQKVEKSQIAEVQVSRKVNVPDEYVKNSEVDEMLRNRNRINATFSEFIADTKILYEQKTNRVWVANDELVPTKSGDYEIIRKEEEKGHIFVSLKKVSNERWKTLREENKICVTEDVVVRKPNYRLVVYPDYFDRDGLVRGGMLLNVTRWPDNTARIAEVELEETTKITSALRV